MLPQWHLFIYLSICNFLFLEFFYTELTLLCVCNQLVYFTCRCWQSRAVCSKSDMAGKDLAGSTKTSPFLWAAHLQDTFYHFVHSYMLIYINSNVMWKEMSKEDTFPDGHCWSQWMDICSAIWVSNSFSFCVIKRLKTTIIMELMTLRRMKTINTMTFWGKSTPLTSLHTMMW